VVAGSCGRAWPEPLAQGSGCGTPAAPPRPELRRAGLTAMKIGLRTGGNRGRLPFATSPTPPGDRGGSLHHGRSSPFRARRLDGPCSQRTRFGPLLVRNLRQPRTRRGSRRQPSRRPNRGFGGSSPPCPLGSRRFCSPRVSVSLTTNIRRRHTTCFWRWPRRSSVHHSSRRGNTIHGVLGGLVIGGIYNGPLPARRGEPVD